MKRGAGGECSAEHGKPPTNAWELLINHPLSANGKGRAPYFSHGINCIKTRFYRDALQTDYTIMGANCINSTLLDCVLASCL